MRQEVVRSGLTVIGGGLAGVSAAIAAARLGRTVALVNNRPVLGGNSSSEVRVWVCGATSNGRHRYARETGIMGELFVENQYRNPDGNPYYWDLVVLEAVRAEPNIRLFLNTDVREVAASGPADARRIESVTGWMTGSERRIELTGPSFADCTGDGLVGFLAGARHRIGREPRAEYGEPWAPEVADDVTLGSTILFYTKDAGHPVKYVAPSFARDVTTTPIPLQRIIRAGDNGCAYWWIEWGGELDTVHDNDRIRDELWAAIYGIWDYIKNSGRFDAQTMTLEWVGAVPGKREYRRFVGDHTLTQHDILAQTPFADRVAFGGWSIDLHPPGGMYASEPGSKHWFSDGVYHVPLRCLYSANVSNLWFAGRNISASHVAFGSTRVMATCAVLGEAVGTAAALALDLAVSPRSLAHEHLARLHRTMVRQDAAVLGVPNEDPADLARSATVTASSTLTRLAVETPVRLPIDWRPQRAQNAFVAVRANPHLALYTADYPEPGVLCFQRRPQAADTQSPQPLLEWRSALHRRAVCLRVEPATAAYRPQLAVGGYARPYGGPQLWASEPPADGQWLTLTWADPVLIGQVRLVFDDDVNEDLINLHHHRTPFEVLPTLVRDYTLQAHLQGEWTPVGGETANRRRHRIISLNPAVRTDRLRILVGCANGARRAHLVSVRAYVSTLKAVDGHRTAGLHVRPARLPDPERGGGPVPRG